MDDDQRNIIINYIVNAQDAINNAKKFDDGLAQIKKQMAELKEQSGASLKSIAAGMKESFKSEAVKQQSAALGELSAELNKAKEAAGGSVEQVRKLEAAFIANKQAIMEAGSKGIKDYNVLVNRATSELKSLDDEGTNSTSIFSQLGNVFQIAFGVSLGNIAVNAIQAAIKALGEAIQYAKEFNQDLLRLSFSARALQRAGLDVTFKSSLEAVDKLKQEFGIFARKDLVEGVAQAQLLTRNFGLTEDQIYEMVRASTALAVVTGKDVNESLREVALFLSSGYAESLQRAGLNVNKVTLANKAAEMGFGSNYMALTGNQKAIAGLNLIMEQMVGMTEDAAAAQDTLTGKLIKAESAMTDMKTQTGTTLQPIILLWTEFQVAVISGFNNLVNLLKAMGVQIAAFFGAINEVVLQNLDVLISVAVERFKSLSDLLSGKISLEDWINTDSAIKAGQDLTDVFYRLSDEYGKAVGLIDADPLEDLGKAATVATHDVEGLVDMLSELSDKLADIAKDLTRTLTDLETDRNRDLAKIGRDWATKREEAAIDNADRIAAIWRDYADDVVGAELKLAFDIGQVNKDFASKREDAEKKYREKELKAEKDFQEKMRRLREDFMMDLEDALRERDAKQVLRLIRQFNLEKDRLERERELNKEENAKDLQSQLEDLEKQRQERIQQLQDEFDFRMSELARQRDIELRENDIKYQAEEEQLKRSMENQRDERLIQYEQQISDANLAAERRASDMLAAFAKEHDITAEGAKAIYNTLLQYFGPGGLVESIYANFQQMVLQTAANVAAANATMYGPNLPSGYRTPTTPSTTPTTPVSSFATGGSLLATKPTLAQFGETPELVTFTPLNQLNSQNVSPVGIGDKQQKMGKIEIWLSPGLEGQIINAALGETADMLELALRNK